MKLLADGLFQLGGFPPNAINVYLMGDVLIDAATRHNGRGILKQLRGHDVRAHALTHAHADHQGASHEVCEALGIPLWCGEADADAVEDPSLILARMPNQTIGRFSFRFFAGPAHPVARRLREGDEVDGFTVLETPGHCAGHVSYWRAADRTLILGDVLNNMNVLTGFPGLHEPPTFFTPDPARNRESARRLADLEPALVCFGHGAPLRDTAKFVRFVKGLRS
jgi:hydroxyacylglutathione hydrolase